MYFSIPPSAIPPLSFSEATSTTETFAIFARLGKFACLNQS
jgi:hypothetical protein